MATLSVTINTMSNSLGDVIIGGTSIPYRSDMLAYSGTVTLPNDPVSGLPVNIWCPMYFSVPGRFIWINLGDPAGNFIAGKMYFVQSDSNGSEPICPNNIQLSQLDAQTFNLTMTANNNGQNIIWNPNFLQSPTSPPPAPNAVSLQTAQQQIAAWKAFIDSPGNINPVYAYYVPLKDIENVLQPPTRFTGNQVGGMRVYFALNNTSIPGDNHALTFHLLVVAVDANGKDIIDTDPNTTNSLIYDTTLPCPKLCSSDAVLLADSPCGQQ